MKNSGGQAILLYCTLIAALLFFARTDCPAQQVFVSGRNSNSVRLYDDATGALVKVFVSPGSGGLSLPQEVRWHPDGYLLVTGRGNTAIKKYNGTTGAYLGNFTNGYVLDNPTKTTIRNGQVYVSQWGTVKNKVVRFDLQTGTFIDEFTSVGVPNGGGHAWDGKGNLYVAQYGDGQNGQVLRFDPSGALIDTFINTTLLQGPINLWFDTLGHLFVVDWTLGDVLQFDGATGAYQSVFISTTSNLEGFDFDSGHHLLICDWSANKVYKYDDTTQMLSTLIHDQALMSPNSVLIHESSTAVSDPEERTFRFTVSPCPASTEVCIAYVLERSAFVQVEILDLQGHRISIIHSGSQQEGAHRLTWDGKTSDGETIAPATYLVSLRVDADTVTQKLVWQ